MGSSPDADGLHRVVDGVGDGRAGASGVHDLVETFPVRVISGIEGIEKPDERIYRLALERAGVEAGESVYVGDNPEFDVDPPSVLGMFAVLVDRRGRFPDHRGARVTDLRDLPALLEAVP